MRLRTRWLVGLVLLVGACSDGGAGSGAAFSGKASCEAMVDAVSAACPDRGGGGRLDGIESCELDRLRYEPIGCGRQLADEVLCATQQPDCSDDALGCGRYLDALRQCETRFLLETGCDRNSGSDGLMCIPGVTNYSIETEGLPYSFQCIGALPGNCQRNPDSTTLSCCSSFADDLGAYFDPFEPGAGDLPPDYGDVDFEDATQCRDFATMQGWGTCEESAGCACDACAAEIAACADVYSCLFVRGCSLGANDCSPGDDPYFTGYGAAAQLEDALEACMQAARCAPSCP